MHCNDVLVNSVEIANNAAGDHSTRDDAGAVQFYALANLFYPRPESGLPMKWESILRLTCGKCI